MQGQFAEGLDHLRAFLIESRARGDILGLSLALVMTADWALQLDRPAEADAPVREAADLLRVGGRWQPWVGFVFGPLAETVVRQGASDEQDILCDAEQQVEASEQYLARPQLLRARGLLYQRRGELDSALDALRNSADVARAQHALVQLGRTLAVLAKVARQHGDLPQAAHADAELAAVVEKIGPEVLGLSWARGLSLPRPGLPKGDPGILSPRERVAHESEHAYRDPRRCGLHSRRVRFLDARRGLSRNMGGALAGCGLDGSGHQVSQDPQVVGAAPEG
jgi:hypothetical protein